jgi:hypothetical protein
MFAYEENGSSKIGVTYIIFSYSMTQRGFSNFPGSSEAVLELPEVSSILFAPTVSTIYENSQQVL